MILRNLIGYCLILILFNQQVQFDSNSFKRNFPKEVEKSLFSKAPANDFDSKITKFLLDQQQESVSSCSSPSPLPFTQAQQQQKKIGVTAVKIEDMKGVIVKEKLNLKLDLGKLKMKE